MVGVRVGVDVGVRVGVGVGVGVGVCVGVRVGVADVLTVAERTGVGRADRTGGTVVVRVLLGLALGGFGVGGEVVGRGVGVPAGPPPVFSSGNAENASAPRPSVAAQPTATRTVVRRRGRRPPREETVDGDTPEPSRTAAGS